jgi:hypothetical protein
MAKFTLVLFPDEQRASQGFHALDRLHMKGTVRGAALVQRDEHGVLSLRMDTDGTLLASLGATVARAPRDLLEFLALDLAPGMLALIAEMTDECVSPVAARMETLGGRVVREWGRAPTTPRSSSGPGEARSSPGAPPLAPRSRGAGDDDTEGADRRGASSSGS